jgi:hypothetical protein
LLYPKSEGNDNERRARLSRAALGYLRTWAYLVRHESDHTIAVKNNLLPEHTTYADLVDLLKDVRQRVTDSHVSGRYRFGELRLSRLNFWARPLLFRRQFRKVAWQYSDYFALYYAPLLFLFGILSVILSAMQLGIEASQHVWETFEITSARFAFATLCLVLLVVFYIVLDFLTMFGREVVYAVKKRWLVKEWGMLCE